MRIGEKKIKEREANDPLVFSRTTNTARGGGSEQRSGVSLLSGASGWMWLLLWQFVGMQRKGSHRSSAPTFLLKSLLWILLNNTQKYHWKWFLLCMRSQPVSPESYIQECLKLIKAPQDVEGSTPPWGNGIGHRWLLQGPRLALGLNHFFESTQRKVIFWRCGRSCPNQR